MRRLKEHSSSSTRLSAYRFVMLMLWSATAIAIVLTLPHSLFVTPRTAIDFSWLFANPWAYGAAVFIVSVYFILNFFTGLQCAFRKKVRVKFAKLMQRLGFLLPVSRGERFWWVLVAVSAGICEELLYRGFLLEYLRGHLAGGPQLGLTLALLLSSLAFGAGHLYQGVKSVLPTAIGGLLFGLVAILSGGLVLPIILHTLVDLQVLWMYRPAMDDPEEADRLISGIRGGALAQPGLR